MNREETAGRQGVNTKRGGSRSAFQRPQGQCPHWTARKSYRDHLRTLGFHWARYSLRAGNSSGVVRCMHQWAFGRGLLDSTFVRWKFRLWIVLKDMMERSRNRMSALHIWFVWSFLHIFSQVVPKTLVVKGFCVVTLVCYAKFCALPHCRLPISVGLHLFGAI